MTKLRTVIFGLKLAFSALPDYWRIKTYLSKKLSHGFPKNLKNKMVLYGSVLPHVLSYNFALAKGYKNVNKELVTICAALIPLIDELTDKLNKSATRLEEIYFGSTNSQDIYEETYVLIRSEILEIAKSNNCSIKFEDMLRAQVASLNQASTADVVTLQNLLAGKGGFTMIYQISSICKELAETDLKFIHQCGYWLQLIDDLIDRDKDIASNIHTIATMMDKDKYEQHIKREEIKMMKLIDGLAINDKMKKQIHSDLKSFVNLQRLLAIS